MHIHPQRQRPINSRAEATNRAGGNLNPNPTSCDAPLLFPHGDRPRDYWEPRVLLPLDNERLLLLLLLLLLPGCYWMVDRALTA